MEQEQYPTIKGFSEISEWFEISRMVLVNIKKIGIFHYLD